DVASTTAVIREQVDDVTATMAAGTAKVRGLESVAEGAARGLAEIVAAVEQVEQAAARVGTSAQQNRDVAEQLGGQAKDVGGRAAHRTSTSASSTANSPSPAAARIALTMASATGLRSTLAIPGRASSSEEICDPPSSAGMERAALTLKVAPSYNPPSRPSRILALVPPYRW